MRTRYLLALLLALGAARSVVATTADDVCAPAADPCVVPRGRDIAVTSGSILDFGDRALVLSAGSGTRLDAGNGTMTIFAGSVTLNPGSALLARGGTIRVVTAGDILVLRAENSGARIDVSEFVSPGRITLDAGGGIEMQGVVTAQGAGADGGDGVVTMVATTGDVVLSGEVIASSGGNALGGDATVQAPLGDILMSGVINVTGGIGGGSIDLAAGGSITTLAVGAARLDAKAIGAEGDGGSVELLAVNGDVVVTVPIWAQATGGIDIGGSGGEVSIDAPHGSLTLGAAIDLSGGVPDGDGGDLDAAAGLDLVQTGAITSTGRDQTGVGGAVDLLAQRVLRAGPVDVSGSCGTCFGGDVNLVAWCTIEVPSGVTVRADGDGGGVLVRSGGTLDVHGAIEAGQAIDLLYRDAATPPNLAGAVFAPAPNVVVVPTLVPCGGPTTVTCGNGSLDAGEECDDGDRTSCDGCSGACRVEACGDGVLGCDAAHRVEACDDGNTTSCDGCAGDCTRRDDVCGDGALECGEECDTGGAVDCDAGACSAQCFVEGCGNGRAECSEQCDEGGATDMCSATCELVSPASCGDLVPDPGEGCDDGNLTDCDGCSRLCEPEACGNGVLECAEGCDDFNTSPCDGCSASCRVEGCGNGVVDCGEECDEGSANGTPGSSCLDCRFAPVCSTETLGACIPCGGPLDCDPLGRCAGTDCVEGVCMPDPIDCASDDPCEVGTCDAALGCTFAPVLGFDSVGCRLGDLQAVLGRDGVSPKAATALGRLLTRAVAKLDKAEQALADGQPRRVGRGLRAARRKLVRFGRRVVDLQPKEITDPAVGALLSEKAGDALERIEGLRGDVGA